MHKGLKKALKRCSQVEIYGERGNVLSMEIEKEEIKKAKRVYSGGIGVRVVISNKIGFSYTTALNKIEECVEKALKQARVSEEDPYFAGLPEPEASRYKEPERTFDKQIVELNAEDAMEYCRKILSAVKSEEKRKIRCICTGGTFSAGYDETFILNSEGIEIKDKGTYAAAGLTVVASKGNGRSGNMGSAEETSASEGKVSRLLSEIDFEWIGKEAAKISANSLGGKKVETKEMPVVLSPKAVQSLLAYTTIPQLNAENVQRNQSPYAGKMGEEIASVVLTIVDNGTTPMGVNSRKMDGEGVPSQRTVLVEKGILKNFLYDSYTAGKDKVESTGNAIRSYDELPVIGATNFIIERGKTSKEEIFEEIERGLYIDDVIGAHTASRASGDFSVTAHNAFEIKNGYLQPVKHVMIAGNMQDMLKNVEISGNDSRQIYNVVSPSLMISKMQVIG